MATTETDTQAADRFIESFDHASKMALESVRKFLDTVNGVFPDVSADDGPRKKIIDSAFRMTEQLVGTSDPTCGTNREDEPRNIERDGQDRLK